MDLGAVEAQVMLALESFDGTLLVGLAVWLVIRSGYVTRALGWILMAAGVAYLADTLANAAVADYSGIASFMLAIVAVPSMIGEGWFGIWLVRTRGLAV
jgi:hypothetical protein